MHMCYTGNDLFRPEIVSEKWLLLFILVQIKNGIFRPEIAFSDRKCQFQTGNDHFGPEMSLSNHTVTKFIFVSGPWR